MAAGPGAGAEAPANLAGVATAEHQGAAGDLDLASWIQAPAPAPELAGWQLPVQVCPAESLAVAAADVGDAAAAAAAGEEHSGGLVSAPGVA